MDSIKGSYIFKVNGGQQLGASDTRTLGEIIAV